MVEKARRAASFRCFFGYMIMTAIGGCCGFDGKSSLEAAKVLSSQGSYGESLALYRQIVQEQPSLGDRALFNMGVVYAYARNGEADYGKALQCFQRLIEQYPESRYRHDSEMMIFNIRNAAMKDRLISAQQAQIDVLQQQVKSSAEKIVMLERNVEALKRKLFDTALQHALADKILIEKKERRLTVLSRGEVIKSYRIALGGAPDGPKEREGDSRTPEGTYYVESRTKDSQYHISLRISYPNDQDKKRARELGVSPGGGIMIHGIKNGFGWVGDAQSRIDWTQGCIAVTDEEIEEIDKLVADGTVVEIRP